MARHIPHPVDPNDPPRAQSTTYKDYDISRRGVRQVSGGARTDESDSEVTEDDYSDDTEQEEEEEDGDGDRSRRTIDSRAAMTTEPTPSPSRRYSLIGRGNRSPHGKRTPRL